MLHGWFGKVGRIARAVRGNGFLVRAEVAEGVIEGTEMVVAAGKGGFLVRGGKRVERLRGDGEKFEEGGAMMRDIREKVEGIGVGVVMGV